MSRRYFCVTKRKIIQFLLRFQMSWWKDEREREMVREKEVARLLHDGIFREAVTDFAGARSS